VVGDATTVGEVVLITERPLDGNSDQDAAGLAAELASRIGGKATTFRQPTERPGTSDLRPGQLCIATATSWDILAASDPPKGTALLLVLEPRAAQPQTGADGRPEEHADPVTEASGTLEVPPEWDLRPED